MALLLIVSLGGCERRAEPKGPLPPPEVLVTKTETQDVPITTTWLATLDGIANVSVKARVQGYLVKINYSAGKLVKVGDVLFEIDPRPFQAAVEQAQAALEEAQATATKTAEEAARQESLFVQKAVTERDRDIAKQNALASADAVKAQQASLEEAKINLGFTKVTAPIAGIVGIPNPSIGDLVGPASAELVGLSQVDPIKAIIQISDRDYYQNAKLINEALALPIDKRKAEHELILSDGTVYPHKGGLYEANRQIDEKTGTMEVDLSFPNPDNLLRPGFFGRVRGLLRNVPNGILVPQQAVIETQGLMSVFVIGSGNKAEFRSVNATNRIGSQWLIEGGLKAGETIVVYGSQKVRNGMVVNPKPWSADAEKAQQKAEAK